MSLRHFNNVTTIGALSAPVASSATTFTVTGFTGSPAVPFTVTVDRNTATEEVCLVTAVAGSTLTVTRGYDGTAGIAHTAGAAVEHTAGAIEYNEANAHVNATSAVHGVTGALVGAQGAQSIFDKTLVSPVVQADVTVGDAVVAYDPTGVRNLFRGVDSTGTDVITVDHAGKVNAPALDVAGASALHGAVTMSGTSAHTGAATFTGAVNANGGVAATTVTASGLVTANGGVTVPTAKVVTITDAPTVGTSAVNKTYADALGTSANTASTIMRRDASGNTAVNQVTISGTVTNATDAATKAFADSRGTTLNGTLGALKIASGTATASISGANFANTAIDYTSAGFTATPTVILTPTNAATDRIFFAASAASTTGVTAVAVTANGANAAANCPFMWIAIGR